MLSELAGSRFEPPRWADPRLFGITHRHGLRLRIQRALELYSCDLLFVHRDAEDVGLDDRKAEIEVALEEATSSVPAVCVVPVRMSEAWFLFDPEAIRRAANNPSGTQELGLPALKHLENLKDPKAELKRALKLASGLSGRRLEKFEPEPALYRLPFFIQTYEPLRELPAFVSFRQELTEVLGVHGWLKGRRS